MPSKKRKERPFHGFVACELNKDDKERGKKWIAAQKDFDGVLEKLLDGYKLSISRDDYNDCFQASLTCTDDKSPNNGWCLVGRGPNYLAAIGMVAFKHLIILECVWSEHEISKERDEWG